MNDFVSNLEDYNCRDRKVESPPMFEPHIDDIPEAFYDFGADRDIRISRISFDEEEMTPFQKKLWDLCQKL